MDKKECCRCFERLPIEAFHPNSSKHDGRSSACKACNKKYHQEHYLRNTRRYREKATSRRKAHAAWWQDYKKTLKCSSCPETHPACLQFHHPNPDKDREVSKLVGERSQASVMREVAKCLVLCANCHFKEHDRLGTWQKGAPSVKRSAYDPAMSTTDTTAIPTRSVLPCAPKSKRQPASGSSI